MKTKVPLGIKDGQHDHPDWPLLSKVEAAVLQAFGGHARMGEFVAEMLRRAIDDVVDTPNTGRRLIEDLEKTEKTYLGTKVEIVLRHRMGFSKGKLDLVVDGEDVDVKFTSRRGWMVPPEAVGHVLLMVAADEATGLCWMGLIVAKRENLTIRNNQDKKLQISQAGFSNIRWLLYGREYEANFWRHLDQEIIDAAFDPKVKGTKRLLNLFSRLPRHPIPRRVIQDVTQQLDFTRRVRQNGGARDVVPANLIILNENKGKDAVANLGLPPLRKGEWIAVDVKDERERHIVEQSAQIREKHRLAAARAAPKGRKVAVESDIFQEAEAGSLEE